MQHHTIQYEVLNNHNPDTETGGGWEVEVHAAAEELQAFARCGYLVREGLFEGEALRRLRDALDRLEQREREKRDRAAAGKQSWGFIPRHLMDKDEVFPGAAEVPAPAVDRPGDDGTAGAPAGAERPASATPVASTRTRRRGTSTCG